MARTPIHPGEHLADELRELDISAAELARQIDVPVNRVTGIINGQRSITADTALRLGHWFGISPEFWLNLQKLYELRVARAEIGKRVKGSFPGSRDASRKSSIRLAYSKPARSRRALNSPETASLGASSVSP
jgi:addiction module HigA family antidote